MSSGARPADWPTSGWTDGDFDSFVRSNERATYLQTAAWAKVKASTAWSSQLVGFERGKHGENASTGSRVLTRPIPLLPWRFAYAPRGPIVEAWSLRTFLEYTSALKIAAVKGGPLARTAIVRIDPELEADAAFEILDEQGRVAGSRPAVDAFRQVGWRRAHDMQPRKTRIVDLTADEESLLADLRKKWRQYVNKARSNGIVVRDVDPNAEPDAFGKFYAVMREVSKRTALPLRAESAFREVWASFAPSGESRLLFAENASGEVHAVLLLVRCGSRVVEPYGGMTEAGADSRANYLLKWEAIRTSKEQGATSYDMWGLIGTGIDHFKAGFGGREVEYIGAWDLTLDPLGATAFRVGERGRQLFRAARRRIRGENLALPPAPGSDA